MRPLLLATLVALGCGSSAPTRDGGGDLGASSGSCSTASDCRLYSSYCNTAPCQCLALPAHSVDPPCVVGAQACLVDPCLNESAACTGGVCTVSP